MCHLTLYCHTAINNPLIRFMSNNNSGKESSERQCNPKLSSPAEQQAQIWEMLTSRNHGHDDHHDGDGEHCTAAANTNDHPNATAPTNKQNRHWPTYDTIISHMAQADYNHTLTCPHDVLAPPQRTNHPKIFCPFGVTCCAKVELFDIPADFNGTPYTGLLQPGTTLEHCILRLSTALRPPAQEIKSRVARAILYATGEKLRTARLFPAAALKVFVNHGGESGNLLFGGSKVGQREEDYFAHCLCTCMTEQMPRPVKPFVRKFWTYSDYPLSLGVSDFCQRTAENEAVPADEMNFPFALILKPVFRLVHDHGDSSTTATAPSAASANTTRQQQNVDSFDSFVDHTLAVPAGTILFDVFACPDPYAVPDPTKLERIGRITTTSSMLASHSMDGLFFRHQKKEHDYQLRPTWPRALQVKVTIDGGRNTGTVGKLAGWKLFEQHIAQGAYVDFESQKDEEEF